MCEAEAFPDDILRENGVDTVAEMAIVGYPDDWTTPVMILEGAQFVERHRVSEELS